MPVHMTIDDRDASNAAKILKECDFPKSVDRALQWLILGSGEWWEIANLLEGDIFQHRLKLAHHRRAVRSVLGALKEGPYSLRTKSLGRILRYLPQGFSYAKMRSDLLTVILATPMEEWLLHCEAATDWKYLLMRGEMDRIIAKVKEYNSPKAVASLFALNNRQSHAYFENRDDGELFSIVVDGSDLNSAWLLYQHGSTWLGRQLSDSEKERLAKTVATLAVTAAKDGERQCLEESLQYSARLHEPSQIILRNALGAALAGSGVEETTDPGVRLVQRA